jgi:hypothetical protein
VRHGPRPCVPGDCPLERVSASDLAVIDERGYCTIECRLKDMIIRDGENIYPR